MSNLSTTLVVNRADAYCRNPITLTSGMVGVTLNFEFSSEWTGLTKTVSFTCGTTTKYILLGASGTSCEIPHEVLADPRLNLIVGVYGSNATTVVIPTIYCAVGLVNEGTSISPSETFPFTPSLYQQVTALMSAVTTELGNVKEAAIKQVAVDASGANQVGVASVSLTTDWVDATDHSKGKKATFVFTNLKGLTGATGNGIASITITDNVLTITQTNGTTTTYNELATLISSVTTAESSRATAEASRVTAETSRATAETARYNAEAERYLAENLRVGAETSRSTAETTRASSETGRVSAETGRVSAETGRVNAENLRDANEIKTVTASVDNNIGTPDVDVTKANNNLDLKFKNLKAYSPNITITTIPGGHRVKITDEAHPSGQTFDVMDGTGSGDMHSNIYDAEHGAKQVAFKADLSEVAYSNDYDDLDNKPTKTSDFENDGDGTNPFLTQHQSLAEYRKSAAQDIIDNTKYVKPATGIPKTDMASDVQTSLGKADTALQEHQSLASYRTSAAQDVIDAAQNTNITALQTAIPTKITKYLSQVAPSNANVGDIWEIAPDYMCITAEVAGVRVYSTGYSSYSGEVTIEYSLDLINWSTFIAGHSVTLTNVGDKIYFRGDNETLGSSSSEYYTFCTSAGSVSVSGNVMSLLDKKCAKSIVPDYCFFKLFNEANITSSPKLPATTVGVSGYEQMFNGCTNLVVVPKLPATSIDGSSYSGMFKGCSSLKVYSASGEGYDKAWTIPQTGTIPSTGATQMGPFYRTIGDYSSTLEITLNTTFYTQNEPV